MIRCMKAFLFSYWYIYWGNSTSLNNLTVDTWTINALKDHLNLKNWDLFDLARAWITLYSHKTLCYQGSQKWLLTASTFRYMEPLGSLCMIFAYSKFDKASDATLNCFRVVLCLPKEVLLLFNNCIFLKFMWKDCLL